MSLPDMYNHDEILLYQSPEVHLEDARVAVLGLMKHRFGNTNPSIDDQLEQVLAEIQGSFEDVEA